MILTFFCEVQAYFVCLRFYSNISIISNCILYFPYLESTMCVLMFFMLPDEDFFFPGHFYPLFKGK